MDCKFNIGDYVYYRGNKPSDIYLIIGRTEYSRKKTIYCGKDRLVHEPTYELINTFYVKDRTIKDIADVYGIPEFSNCREHHMTLKESRVEDIHTIPFKFNLNDYVTLKNGSVSYKITSRTEWIDGSNPTYELMRITESGHVYFEYYNEELINEEKICVKEVVDNFKKICDELYEEECQKLKEDMENMDNKSYEKKQTNQDKLAEMVRTMDPKDIATFIITHTDSDFCHKCPASDYCDKYILCSEDGWDRIPDENGEILDCNQIFERWLKEEAE